MSPLKPQQSIHRISTISAAVDSQIVAFTPRGSPLSDMPFDGKRMIYCGFTPIVDA